jgi:outer membrane protein
MSTQLAADRQPSWSIDPVKIYTLSERIDLAEFHNPETRAAWERVRLRADELGFARSAYYPTLVATVFAASDRQPALIGEYLSQQEYLRLRDSAIVVIRGEISITEEKHP